MLKRLIIETCFLLVGAVGAVLASTHEVGSDNIKYRASDLALAALVSDESIAVDQNEWIVFSPAGSNATVGFIIYPGALCDPQGYAPLARELAAKGYLAVIMPMPKNLAIMDVDKVNDVKAAYPVIDNWAIGGHSYGGASAIVYLRKNPMGVSALVMFDSYTNEGLRFDDGDLPILSLYGNAHHNPDRPDIFENAKQFMPADVMYHLVDGADHMQFGSFRQEDIAEQNTATISEGEQQAQVVAATLAFLGNVYSDN